MSKPKSKRPRSKKSNAKPSGTELSGMVARTVEALIAQGGLEAMVAELRDADVVLSEKDMDRLIEKHLDLPAAARRGVRGDA